MTYLNMFSMKMCVTMCNCNHKWPLARFLLSMSSSMPLKMCLHSWLKKENTTKNDIISSKSIVFTTNMWHGLKVWSVTLHIKKIDSNIFTKWPSGWKISTLKPSCCYFHFWLADSGKGDHMRYQATNPATAATHVARITCTVDCPSSILAKLHA